MEEYLVQMKGISKFPESSHSTKSISSFGRARCMRCSAKTERENPR